MKTKMPLPNTGHLYIGFEMVEWCRENCPNDWTKPSHDRIVLTYKEDNDRFLEFFRDRLSEFESENDPDSEQIESLKRQLEDAMSLLAARDTQISLYKESLAASEEKNSELETKVKAYDWLRDEMNKIIGGKTFKAVPSGAPKASSSKSTPTKAAMDYKGDVGRRVMLRQICENLQALGSSSDSTYLKSKLKIRDGKDESMFWAALATGKKEGVLDYKNNHYYLGKI